MPVVVSGMRLNGLSARSQMRRRWIRWSSEECRKRGAKADQNQAMTISTEMEQLRERVNREQKERGKMDNSSKRIEETM